MRNKKLNAGKELKKELIEQIVNKSEMFYGKSQKVPQTAKNADIYSYYFFNIEEYITLSKKYGEEIVREIRGITFIEGVPFPSISKFFNLNEHQYAIQTEDLPEKVLVYEKIDGSLISPTVVNGKVVLKSKTSFESRQAKIANKLMNEKYPELESGIKKLIIEENIYPQFEFISPENKIVVPYNETELILIAIRYWNSEKGTFDYLTEPKVLNQISKFLGVKMARPEIIDKEELLKKQQTEIGIEGWIAITPKGLVKIKTKWYLEKHKLYNSLNNEFEIFKLVLDEQIDDLISLLDENDKQIVIQYIGKIQNYLNEITKELTHYFNEWIELGSKEFALKYQDKTKLIGLFNRFKNDFESGNISHIVKEIVKKQFRKRSDIIKQFGEINLTSAY